MNPNPEISDLLTFTDYSVFFIIIILTILFVVWGNTRRPKNESDSFLDMMLMGRKLTLPVFTATLVATWYGGIFGVSQIAFDNGIYNFVSQGVFWYATYLIFAFFIIDKIKSYKAITLPDLIKQMFGTKSGKLSAIYNVLNLIPIAYTISLGLMIQMVFGVQLEHGIVIGVAFVLSYSFFGGFRSVVYSDIFQFFVMVSSIILVLIISVYTFGVSEIFQTLPKSYFHPMGTYTILEIFSWGLIALSTLVDPNFYQRCFAAKDLSVAKKGILLSTIIWIVFDLCLTFGAIYAKAAIPQANSEFGYFFYALQLLPDGLRGFFLAGICATILSTLDSYIFLAGTTISFDLVKEKYKQKMSTHNLGIIFVAIISICLSMVFNGNIKSVWKTLGSISSAALLVPVVFGYIYPKRLSDNSFVISSLLGACATVYWRLSGYKEYYQLDEIYIGIIFATIGIISCLVLNKNLIK